MISMLIAGIFFAVMPAWGAPAEDHYRPPMAEKDGGLMQNLQNDLIAAEQALSLRDGANRLGDDREKRYRETNVPLSGEARRRHVDSADYEDIMERYMGQGLLKEREALTLAQLQRIFEGRVSSSHPETASSEVTFALGERSLPDRKPVEVKISSSETGDLIRVHVRVDTRRAIPEDVLGALLARQKELPDYLAASVRILSHIDAPFLLYGKGAGSTFSDRVKDAQRLRRDFKTALGINSDYFATHPEEETALQEQIIEAEARLSALENVGPKLFPTVDSPLSGVILNQLKRVNAPVVLVSEPAYYYYSFDAWAALWRRVRQEPRFGKVGSGIVTAFLPLTPREGVLQAMDAEKTSNFFNEMNAFASKKTGLPVDLTPEDFGMFVPAERLSEVAGIESYIQQKLEEKGGPSPERKNLIFARREVARLFEGRENSVAFTFDLPVKDTEVGLDHLNSALIARIEEGLTWTIPVEVLSTGFEEEAIEAVRKFRETLRRL